jgi:cell wall-associated NlpC family hydrolase
MTTLDQQELRARVAAEAMTWRGTPYHHHGRIKGVGVDCAQILAAVFEAVGLIPPTDLGAYAREWHLHHGDELYLAQLLGSGAAQLPANESAQVGDVMVFRFGRCYSHGAIVVEAGADPLLIHSYLNRGVILSRLSEAPLAGRLHQTWSLIK